MAQYTVEQAATKDKFDIILGEQGLPPVYEFDAAETERQSKLPGKVDILTAFKEGVKALFMTNAKSEQLDNLLIGPRDDPESFGLKENPSDEEVRAVILKGLAESKLKISLLPEEVQEDSHVFPPEYGESVKDYWIWYVSTDYFPGPLWILVKRDGQEPAFHYGYM